MKSYVVDKLSTLFTKISQFKIPPYQREYCWGKLQWQQLWEDLEEAADTGSTHFLGIAVTVPLSSHNRVIEENAVSNHRIYDQFLLIDGQQRITTLLLLAKAFEDQLSAQLTFLEVSGVSYDYSVRKELHKKLTSFLYNMKSGIHGEATLRVSLSGRDQPGLLNVFKEVVNRNTGQKFVPNYYKKEKPKKTQLEKGVEFFKNCIEVGGGKYNVNSDADRDFQENYMKAHIEALLYQMTLVVVELNRDETGDVAFERINGTGKPLAPADLLKNMLFSIEKLEVLREHPGITDSDTTFFPFASLLDSKTGSQLELGFKLYFQLHYGMYAPAKNKYCPLFEKAMLEDKTRLLSDMRIILDAVSEEGLQFARSYLNLELVIKVAKKLIASRNLQIGTEVLALLRQVAVLVRYTEGKDKLLQKNYIQVMLKLFSSVLSGTPILSSQLTMCKAYCVNERGVLKVPAGFGMLPGLSEAARSVQALEFLSVVYDIPLEKVMSYKAIPLIANSLEDASELSPGISWKDVHGDWIGKSELCNVVNYVLVPADSSIDANSTVEEKFRASGEIKVPLYYNKSCAIDTFSQYFAAKKSHLTETFFTQHMEAFQYLDIANEPEMK